MKRDESGFTFVEIVIIAPIVILAIGVFIAVFINLTADVLVSRVKDQLTYDVTDTLTKIKNDIRLSNSFLAINSFTPTAPQGVNDDTTAFKNADATNGASLVLSQHTTVGNPVAGTSGYVFLTNTPHACNSPSLRQNTILEANIIYFVKNGSLWRRVILPGNYATTACTLPWQLPSCATGGVGAMCKTIDAELVKGVDVGDFTVTYYPTTTSNTPNTQASDPTVNVTTRNNILATMKSVEVVITVKKAVAGHSAEAAGSRRVDLPD